MKLCAACSQELPRESFSKTQWQLKQHQRRCKECIAVNRDVKLGAPDEDEALFKEPSRDECPICLLLLPLLASGVNYQPCCGKMICTGCIHEVEKDDTRGLCPFCRTPAHTTNEEYIRRVKTRAKGNDAVAVHQLGSLYNHGRMSLQQNLDRAMELWHRAGELGCPASYRMLSIAYHDGSHGVVRDMEKADQYTRLAAMGGDVEARHNLGIVEWRVGNARRALKHWMVAAGAGFDNSLENVRKCFLKGLATKDDFEKTLRAHKEARDEMKSDQREVAAAIYYG